MWEEVGFEKLDISPSTRMRKKFSSKKNRTLEFNCETE